MATPSVGRALVRRYINGTFITIIVILIRPGYLTRHG
jgi:hypothetical protein